MEYNFKEIEKRWHQYWIDNKTYKVTEDKNRPKYYVLDMFPYPSGAGLHVGHPLGYIASDIYSRYKRLNGFNVLHPMGYDAYGLPAEQYAIQTGQHPVITTAQNINRYREQLDKIGFSFDWSREIQTCDPGYYRWTQWAFVQMFNSYYCYDAQQARPIAELIHAFEMQGTKDMNIACSEELSFTAEEWKAKSEKEQQEILLNYRVAYLRETTVNWCPALGTVLANDEVINGLSERGGYPVEQRLMRQWSLRVSAYAQRLLDGLNVIDWSESIKETQRNWIGRSEGAEMQFKVKDSDIAFDIFTTRADTIFGVTFMVLAPESEYVSQVTIPVQKAEIEAYLDATKRRTERDRLVDKKITGVFTGSYAVNPLNGEEIPIWVSDYVLAGYGTGAIMAVPGHDSRDHAFAKHFNLPIIPLIEGCDVSEESFDAKEGIMMNSGFLNELEVKEAIEKARQYIKENNLGRIKVNYRLRDAIFSRQRYWGEPFPVYYKDDMPYMLPLDKLPLELPEVDKYLPTETGEPPLGRATKWAWDTVNEKVIDVTLIDRKTIFPLELNTMPGFAGSSAYYLRYMDPHNSEGLVSTDKDEYWRNVDLYIGGTEHATGHLIYSRFWNKFLYDIGVSCEEEPFKKLINQGMIQGMTSFAYRFYVNKFIDKDNSRDTFDTECISYPIFISKNIYDEIKSAFIEIDQNETDIDISEINDIYVKKMVSILDKYQFVDAFDVYKGKFSDVYNIDVDKRGFILDTQPLPIRVNVNYVRNDILDIKAIRGWKDFQEFKTAEFIFEDGKYICGSAVEKMSKSYHNVVNPDVMVDKYGADTLRMYEMFLGPLELSKPWDTNGVDGVHRFLRKVWNLFYKGEEFVVTDEQPTKEELKSLHKLIKKVSGDIETFSFNTSVSAFMICVNELTSAKCSKKAILNELLILLAPFAPFVSEELWHVLGNATSVCDAKWPVFNEEYLAEDSFKYGVAFNGKVRFELEFSAETIQAEVEKVVLAHELAQKWLDGKIPKKVIFVPMKMINVVL